MNEIIRVVNNVIGGETVQTVNARDLHAFLEVGKDFSTWIKMQIDRARLVENRDYLVFTQKGGNIIGGRPQTEYHLILDAAKHIGMLSGTDKGFEVREYFIECERIAKNSTEDKYNNLTSDRKAMIELLIQTDRVEKEQAAQARQIADNTQSIREIQAEQSAYKDGVKYYTVVGYCNLNDVHVTEKEAQWIGKRASHLSRENNITIDSTSHSMYGKVNKYHESVLDLALEDYFSKK